MAIIPSFNSLNPPNFLNLPYSLPPSSSITSPLFLSLFTVKNFTFHHHRCKKFLNQPPFSSSSTSSSLSPLQSAGYSLPAPSVKIYGNKLYVADQCDKATKENRNLYLYNVVNFEVSSGYINVAHLKSFKKYKAVFYVNVNGVSTGADGIRTAVFDHANKEIKCLTRTGFETAPFEILKNEGGLTFRLIRHGNTLLRRVVIKRLELQELE